MLPTHMSIIIPPACRHVPTEATDVGVRHSPLLSLAQRPHTVRSEVLVEVRRIPEFLATYTALEGLVACVGA